MSALPTSRNPSPFFSPTNMLQAQQHFITTASLMPSLPLLLPPPPPAQTVTAPSAAAIQTQQPYQQQQLRPLQPRGDGNSIGSNSICLGGALLLVSDFCHLRSGDDTIGVFGQWGRGEGFTDGRSRLVSALKHTNVSALVAAPFIS